MRFPLYLSFFLSSLSLAYEVKFSSPEYSFNSHLTVKVFEIPSSAASDQKRKICFANFNRRGSALGQAGVGGLSEIDDCLRVSNFGAKSSLFVGQGVLEGPLGNAPKPDSVQVKIGDRLWESFLKPNIIFSEIGRAKSGEREFYHICFHDLRPLGTYL